MIWYAVLRAWAVVSPILGPLWAVLGPLLPFRVAGKVGKMVIPLVAMAALSFGAWQIYKAFQPDWKPDVVSISDVRASQAEAKLKALREAAAKKDEVLVQRETEIELQARELRELEAKLKEARDASNNQTPTGADDAFIAADDPWVRGK